MSALAQFHALGGDKVTGSDRLLDRGQIGDLRFKFRELGIELFAQDGSGISPDTRKVIVSGAIEEDNPELKRARELNISVEHRADALAAHVAAHRSIAVAGTSGKSTVTAMIFEILTAAGQSPSLITGAPLTTLSLKGLVGNAYRGAADRAITRGSAASTRRWEAADRLIIEADESDGTLPKYHPEIGLLLNMGKDHKEITELRELFLRFREQSRKFVVNADEENLSEFQAGAMTFGFRKGEVRGEHLDLSPKGCWFVVDGAEIELNFPGRHNAENALAAAAAARAAGASLQETAAALSIYKGVSRRFEEVGQARGVFVVDDYAHNPDKVRAVFSAGRLRAERILAVFQPHGFGPTRFLKDDFIKAFSDVLGPEDVLWLPDIYYAGGTAVKDISSEDLAGPIRDRGGDARYAPERAGIPRAIAGEARSGDLVLVLGARDPTLSAFAREVLEALGQ